MENGGYVITDANGENFIEYSMEKENFILDTDKKYYYNEPCSIYQKSDEDTMINIHNNEECQITDIDFEISDEIELSKRAAKESAKSIASSISNLRSVKIIEEKGLSNETRLYSYNPDGRCGAVAAAIVLTYYDCYKYNKYVSGNLTSFTGCSLINFLVKNYLGTETYYADLTSGLNRYLKDRGISTRFYKILGKKSTSVFNKVKSYIKKDCPLIIGLTGHPSYEEHWVVGTGYSIVYSNEFGYANVVIVNDGWGNKNVRINNCYVDGAVYIQ